MKREIIAINQAKYITVLDFEIGRVFQYKVEKWDIENESCEEFLTRMGHNLTNCEWMVHETAGIIKNNDGYWFSPPQL